MIGARIFQTIWQTIRRGLRVSPRRLPGQRQAYYSGGKEKAWIVED
jgi:hypothetical protein